MGPTGSGKDAVCKGVLERKPNFQKCRTATTRERRTNQPNPEIHGVHQDFHEPDDFHQKRREGYFLETCQVHGTDWYGTPRKNFMELVEQGAVIILNVDMNGFDAIKAIDPEELGDVEIYGIFVTAGEDDKGKWEPVLRARVISRNGGTAPADIDERMNTARVEMERQYSFDHRVVNADGELEDAIADVLAFIERRLIGK